MSSLENRREPRAFYARTILPNSWFCFALLSAAFATGLTASEPEPEQTSIAVEALTRLKGVDIRTNAAVREALLRVLGQVRGTAQFVELVRDFNIPNQEEPLLQFAAKAPSSSMAAEAMRIVLKGHNKPMIATALEGTNGPALIEALGNTRSGEMVPWLEPLLKNEQSPGPARRQAVRALAKGREGAQLLLKLASSGGLPEDLRQTAAQALNSSESARVRAEAAMVLPLPKAANAEPLPPISKLAGMQGDAKRGEAVFRREIPGCIKCHQVNGSGTDFGPNLSEIGTKLAKEALYESILDPSAGISFGYEAWKLVLKNGDELDGLIASQSADELTFKAVGGVVSRFKTSEIASRTQQKLSIMPTGLEQTMTTQELVDLVEYLASLKKAQR